MRWVRSWPAVIPEHRAYVVDELPRFTMDAYDYAGLGDLDDDICLLEWDIALDPADMATFQRQAMLDPSRVIVAPYRLHTVNAVGPVWAHRHEGGNGTEYWIKEGDPFCDYFSFGCIYLPRDLIRQFLAAPAPARGRSPYLRPEQGYNDCRMHDQTFSIWHRHHQQTPQETPQQVYITWDVRPAHLHTWPGGGVN